MSNIVIESVIGPDGTLHLDVPIGIEKANQPVRVVIEAFRKPMSRAEWGEFVRAMGEYLETNGCKTPDSIVYEAFKADVPIFVPAFSDCSAGFGLVAHQHSRGEGAKVSLDSAKDFYELTKCKIANPVTGLFMIGGGVPKNFAQDVVVAADVLESARLDEATRLRTGVFLGLGLDFNTTNFTFRWALLPWARHWASRLGGDPDSPGRVLAPFRPATAHSQGREMKGIRASVAGSRHPHRAGSIHLSR